MLEIVKNLSPMIRSDGYHILSDATGVPDLYAHMGPTLKRLLPWKEREPSALKGWPRAFVTGWVLIVVPILLPLVNKLGINLVWFCTLVAVCLQTAWLSPPVALSAYFLKGVVPDWPLKDIYAGMMQFMVLQVIGLLLVLFFPQLALWLPQLMRN